MAVTLTQSNVMAETLETAYIDIIEGKVSSYTIGGRTFSRLNIKDLFDQLKYWRARANKEQYGSVTQADVRPYGE